MPPSPLLLAPLTFRLTRHKRTNSRPTLDSILATPLDIPTSRPSTASTNSSFSTAFSSLEAGSPFRYYLPYISTPTSPVYTRREIYACNLVQRVADEQVDRVGIFQYYVPRESTEEGDVYAADFDIVAPLPLQSGVVAEQKVRGGLEHFFFQRADGVGGTETPLEDNAGANYVRLSGDEWRGEDIDIGSYTAGEKLDTYASPSVTGDEKTKKQGGKASKSQHRKVETLATMSSKMKKLLKKLHLSKKNA